MKRAGTVIDVGNDTAIIFGKKVNLDENRAGHYVAKFDDYIYQGGETSVMWSGFTDNEENKVKADILKMHKGLGHPSQSALEKMIKASGHFNKHVNDILNKIYQSCETCLKHAKSKAKPKVAPPTAHDVNDTMSIDLRFYGKKRKIILYMVDEFSRYVTAAVIKDKKGETVVKAILDKWILGTPYGPPSQIKSDNGGEFVNGAMRDMCEMYGIKHICTPAWSPWANGGNERNHYTVDMILDKILEDEEGIEFEDALAKAVYAKNTMLNVHGYSPSQILTGKQPRIPGACNDNLPPADNTEVNSKSVQDSINGIQKARQAFAQVDNSNRLRKAMRVQESPLVKYNPGDTVYYKFGNDENWHGPARVLAQENKIVFLRHGGHIVSLAQSRIFRPVPGQMVPVSPDSGETQPAPGQPDTHTAPSSPPPMETSSDSDSSSLGPRSSDDSSDSDADVDSNVDWEEMSRRVMAERSPARGAPLTQSGGTGQGSGEAGEAVEAAQDSPDQASRPASDRNSLDHVSTEAQAGARPTEPFRFRPDQIEAAERAGENAEKEGFEKEKRMPKKGNWILYKEKDKNVWFRAQVLGKGVKATSKLPYYNIAPEFDNDRGVNLDDFDWTYDSPTKRAGKEIYGGPSSKKSPGKSPGSSGSKTSKKKASPGSSSPKLRSRRQNAKHVNTYLTYYTYADQISRAEKAEQEDISYVVFIPKDQWDKPFVKEAKERELNNFRQYGAFEEVRDVGQPRMGAQWIITEKMYGDVKGAKGRIVVNGNQERSFEHIMSDSPTVSKQTLRIQFALAAQFGWEVVMGDITSAFLQSDLLDRELYVQPPKDCAPPGVLWRLLKPMYGLEDASLQWYKTLADRLIKLGCTKLITDPAVFFWLDKEGKLGGIISWHVDDMIACGSDEFYKVILMPLMETFNFGSASEGKYRCLGWNVMHRHDDILVSQDDYIETKIDFMYVNTKQHMGYEKLGPELASMARGHIGKLRWLSDQSRLELAAMQLELSMQAHAPTYDTVKLINKMVAIVKNRQYHIRYSKLKTEQWYITVFSDASLRGLPDKVSSAMGYVIFLSEGYRFRERNGCNVLSWKSCKTRRIVASTYDAETLALTTALEEAIFIKHQLTTMLGRGKDDILIEAFCDCNDTVAAVVANKPLPNSKSRLAALEVARIKEMKDLKMIHDIHWCPTNQQLADVLTKKTASMEAIIHTVSKGKFFD